VFLGFAELLTSTCAFVVGSLKLYNNLVERCFKDCVQDFRSKNLAKDEEKVRELVQRFQSPG